MQVLNDSINQLRLHKLYGPARESLNLNAQKVAYVPLIINSETMAARSQVCDHCIDRGPVGTKNIAVVDVDQEDDVSTIVQTWVQGTRLETDFF